MSTTPTPAGAAVPTPAPEPTVDAVHDHLAQWVLDPEYPCLGARAVFNRDRARIVTTGRLGSASSSLDVYQALRDFGDDADPDEGFTSLVAAFGGQAPPSERAFEDRLWTTLQHLHDFDDTPWNAEVSSDPADVDFSFSIGGIAYFVVGLHPGASRDARRTPWPVLVFNLHSQFEEPQGLGSLRAHARPHPKPRPRPAGLGQPDGGRPRRAVRGPAVLRSRRRPVVAGAARERGHGTVRSVTSDTTDTHDLADGFSRLAPQTGTSVRLAPGDVLTLLDPTGVQVSDLYCVSADDVAERLSSGRSIDFENSIRFTTGSRLWSNRSRPMLTVVEDTCGSHDFLLTPCSQQTFDILYPDLGGAEHPSLLRQPRRCAGAPRGPPRRHRDDAQRLHERLGRRDRRACTSTRPRALRETGSR